MRSRIQSYDEPRIISMIGHKYLCAAFSAVLGADRESTDWSKATLIVSSFMMLALTPFAIAEPSRITLDVDATDVSHSIEHAHLVLPVEPGPLTLAYPKWVPGEHAPNGPITQLINLHFLASGREIGWRRGPLDAFSFHIIVPTGTRTLTVDFDYLSPPETFGAGFGKSPNMTLSQLVVLFNQLVLYPSQQATSRIAVDTTVKLPKGWSYDCALLLQLIGDDTVKLPTVSLSILGDSPLIAGRNFRTVHLTDFPVPTRISIASDAPSALAIEAGLINRLRTLVPETTAVFGPGHYRRYVWLLSLDDVLDHDGTEHLESSDIRQSDALFTDPKNSIQMRLFPHEFVHSWNGKFRRPDGLTTRNLQQAMNDELLWAYEGLTRYYGDFVLTARSGLATAQQSRDYLAYVAAQVEVDRPGRAWRSLADTAIAVPSYRDAPFAGTNIRRASDYYNEMLLVWLEADMMIREQSHGRWSLDDFCNRFFGGTDRSLEVKSYTRSDIVTSLSTLAPLDWQRFFTKRIDDVAPQAPMNGLRMSGWQLTFDDTPNPFLEDVQRSSTSFNLSFSLGIWINADGMIQDVLFGSPAFQAGISPGSRLDFIDKHPWSLEVGRQEILAAEHKKEPITLTIAVGKQIKVVEIEYYGGLRYPHLTPIASQTDQLEAILAPRTSGPARNATSDLPSESTGVSH
jgi:predicted metalloprotease with PDZ domain